FIMLLYSILILVTLAIIETVISKRKLCLLGQSVWIGVLLVLSGAFIPTLYFPLKLQAFLPYIFSGESFHWLQEIMLNGRFYADYIPLLLMNGAGFCVLIGLSSERSMSNNDRHSQNALDPYKKTVVEFIILATASDCCNGYDYSRDKCNSV